MRERSFDRRRASRVGLVSGGLAAYWPQFPELRPMLEVSNERVRQRLESAGAEVVSSHFVSTPEEGIAAGDELRRSDVDLVVIFLATYMTSTMVVPIAQRSGAPALLLDLAPTPSMDHPNTDTGRWLAYCGVCPLPEVANAFERCDVPFRSISGWLEDEGAWARVETWVKAARVRSALRNGRHGLMGHLYPGMLDTSTDLTLVHAHFGGHVEVLEFDDLRVRVEDADGAQVDRVLDDVHRMFELDASVSQEDLGWAARVAVGLDRLARDFRLDSLAYYHRGLRGEVHERLGAGMILGASLLTAAGVPACGEYELRTSLAMLILERLGAGGAFAEFQALNFSDGVVEMGHDGPSHLAISDARPILRGLDRFHGKRGWGVSVEFDVRHGPVTLLSLTQRRDGAFRMVVAEGEVVGGPHPNIGNTTSRIDFGCDPGLFADAWAAARPAHHWAIGVGHLYEELRATADLLGVELVRVQP
ncbi:MAG: arabinose isomerase [Chloroflexi bacterium GWC2_73_18]|nr:MAG: arabinose isomerase [Chloroflexi bacterium GWC2_73_18]